MIETDIYPAYTPFMKDLEDIEPSTEENFNPLDNFHKASIVGYSKVLLFKIPYFNVIIKIEMIWSEISSFMRSIHVSITRPNQPHKYLLKFFLRCRNFKELLSLFASDQQIKNYLDSLPGPVSTFIDMFPAFDENKKQKCEEDGEDCLTSEIILQWMGHDILFYQGTALEIIYHMNKLLEATQNLNSDNWISVQMFNFLNKLIQGIKVHRTFNLLPFESIKSAPTLSGLYLIQTHISTLNIDVLAQASWGIFSNSKLTFKPSADILYETRTMLNDVELFSENLQINANPELDMSLSVGNEGWKISLDIPKNSNILKYQNYYRIQSLMIERCDDSHSNLVSNLSNSEMADPQVPFNFEKSYCDYSPENRNYLVPGTTFQYVLKVSQLLPEYCDNELCPQTLHINFIRTHFSQHSLLKENSDESLTVGVEIGTTPSYLKYDILLRAKIDSSYDTINDKETLNINGLIRSGAINLYELKLDYSEKTNLDLMFNRELELNGQAISYSKIESQSDSDEKDYVSNTYGRSCQGINTT